MGSCTYYLKARFETPPAALEARRLFRLFLRESWRARRFLRENPSFFATGGRHAWGSFQDQFPFVAEYLWALGDVHLLKDVARELPFGQEYPSERFLKGVWVDDSVLHYSEEVWHLADWSTLCQLLTVTFGAEAVDWISDEEVVPWHSLVV